MKDLVKLKRENKSLSYKYARPWHLFGDNAEELNEYPFHTAINSTDSNPNYFVRGQTVEIGSKEKILVSFGYSDTRFAFRVI